MPLQDMLMSGIVGVELCSRSKPITTTKRYVHIISPEQTENSKRFWSFIKSKKQDNSDIPPLRGNDGLIYSDSNNNADILNTQFKSAYTQEDQSSLPDHQLN
jgi:hypothetical protein